MRRLRYQDGPLDGMDAKLLRLLVTCARVTTAELARRVGLSPPSVGERVRRLEETGVIENYTAVMNPPAIGLPISAYLRIRPGPGQLQRTLEIVSESGEIVRCDRVTGDDCLIARAHVESLSHLEELVDRLAPYAVASTSVIQSTPVPYRMPTLPVRR